MKRKEKKRKKQVTTGLNKFTRLQTHNKQANKQTNLAESKKNASKFA